MSTAIVVVVVAVIPVGCVRVIIVINVRVISAKIVVIRAISPAYIHGAIPVVTSPIKVGGIPIGIVPVIGHAPIGVVKVVIDRSGRVFPRRIALGIFGSWSGVLLSREAVRNGAVLLYISKCFRSSCVFLKTAKIIFVIVGFWGNRSCLLAGFVARTINAISIGISYILVASTRQKKNTKKSKESIGKQSVRGKRIRFHICYFYC
jgi:hypothetical protein